MKKLKNSYTDIYGFFIQKKNINKNSVEKIFSLLRVDTTFKTTSYNRMADLNIKLKKYIKKLFSKNVIICDFGVSSGQSTLELYYDLNKIKIKNIYGFDKHIHLKIYRFKKLIFLYSSKNDLLMVEYDKHSLRYRYFFIFKKIEFFFSLFVKFYEYKTRKIKCIDAKSK